ncbi:DnaD domain-containing protein [Lentilactobacillus hilgardii]|uniref:DnaD domain-containing protein n=1 Tax=Lentilactobacillus hilgardii TaxID=1588 RepID=UPI0021A399F8|nr:DnaD domain protein [Lentilactobacillus hilgardii]MCT3397073.1 DnaD domain protein [Lentilactobacillus hilgardii]
MDRYAHDVLQYGQTSITNLLLKNYRKIGMSNEELLLYILIKRNRTLIVPMPEIGSLTALTGYSKQQLFEIFHQMIQKKLAKITQVNVDNQQVDAYDFNSLYEKLSLVEQVDSTNTSEEREAIPSTAPQVSDQQRQEMFESIEKEFGRTLSPLEMESISQWIDLDHYSPKMVELALKEAVLSQVYNLKYMDRILRNWEKRHLKTAQQIEEYNRNRTRNNSETEEPYKGPKIPFIDITNPNKDK